MSEQNNPSSAVVVQNDDAEPLQFKERIEHFAVGYNNSQAVVRFLDTKASAVVASVPVVIGALSALFALIKDWARWDKAFASHHAWMIWIALPIVGYFALALLRKAIAAVNAAFDAITPRKPLDAKPSVIFPYAQSYEQAGADQSFVSRAHFLRSGAKKSDALDDWERQTVRMSQLVKEKLDCVNLSVRELKLFFVEALRLLAALIAITVLCAGVAATGQPTTTPTDPSSVLPKRL